MGHVHRAMLLLMFKAMGLHMPIQIWAKHAVKSMVHKQAHTGGRSACKHACHAGAWRSSAHSALQALTSPLLLCMQIADIILNRCTAQQLGMLETACSYFRKAGFTEKIAKSRLKSVPRARILKPISRYIF